MGFGIESIKRKAQRLGSGIADKVGDFAEKVGDTVSAVTPDAIEDPARAIVGAVKSAGETVNESANRYGDWKAGIEERVAQKYPAFRRLQSARAAQDRLGSGRSLVDSARAGWNTEGSLPARAAMAGLTGALGTVNDIGETTAPGYKDVLDPARELLLGGDPRDIAGRARRAGSWNDLGENWRARQGKWKFAVETITDPANYLSFGSGSVAKGAGEVGAKAAARRLALKGGTAVLREGVLPVAGALGAEALAEQTGNERLQDIAPVAGAFLAGGVGGRKLDDFVRRIEGHAPLGRPLARSFGEGIDAVMNGGVPVVADRHFGAAAGVMAQEQPQQAQDEQAGEGEQLQLGGVKKAGLLPENDFARNALLLGGAGLAAYAGRHALGRGLAALGRTPPVKGVAELAVPSRATDSVSHYVDRGSGERVDLGGLRSRVTIGIDPAAPTGAMMAHLGLEQEGKMIAAKAGEDARGLQATIQQEGIQTRPGAAIDAAIARARAAGDTRRLDVLQQTKAAGFDMLDHPGDYVLTPAQANALAAHKGMMADTAWTEAAHGRGPGRIITDYNFHGWADPTSGDASVHAGGGMPGRGMAFEKGRKYGSWVNGIENGLTPASYDLGAQTEARVFMGQKAVGDQVLIDAIKADPTIILSPGATPANPGDYTTLDWNKLQRTFPTFDNGQLDAVLTSLVGNAAAKGAIDPKDIAAAKAAIKDGTGVGRFNLRIRNDWAQALTNRFDPGALWLHDSGGGKGSAFFRGARETMGSARAIALTWDYVMGAQTTARGLTFAAGQALHGRFGMAKDLASAVLDAQLKAVTPGGWDDIRTFMLTDPRARLAARRGVSNIGVPGGAENDLLGGGHANSWVARQMSKASIGPVNVGAVFQNIEDSQFQYLIPYLKVQVWDKIVQDAAAAKPGLGREFLERQAADVVDNLFGGKSGVKSGLSRERQAVENLIFLAPNFLRSTVSKFGDMTRTGADDITGMYARRNAAGIAATSLVAGTASLAFYLKQSGQYSNEEMLRMLNPLEPDSLTNPSSSRFMSITLPDGRKSNFILGPERTFIKTLFAPVGEGARGWHEAQSEGLQGAVFGTLEQMGFGTARKWRDYAQQRLNIPINVGLDTFRNQDWRGRSITQEDNPLPPLAQKGVWAAQQLLPGTAKGLVGAGMWGADKAGLGGATDAVRRFGIGNFDDNDSGIEGVGAGALGVTVAARNDTPPAVRNIVAKELDRLGITPGFDPVQTYLKETQNIPADQRAAFLARHPEVGDELTRRTQQSAQGLQQPRGRAAVSIYKAKLSEASQERTDALRALSSQNLTGVEYRARRAAIMTKFANDQDRLAKSYLGVQDTAENPTAVRNRILDIARKDAQPSDVPVNAALAELSLIQPESSSREHMDAYYEKRRQFLAALPDDVRAAVRQKTLAQAQAISPKEYRYQLAMEVYGQYQDIPAYRGMTAEESREVNAARNRARSTAEFSGGRITQERAVMMDKSLTPSLKGKTLRVLRDPEGMTNPARRRFKLNPANLWAFTEFFSDIGDETIQAALRPARPSAWEEQAPLTA